AIASPIPGSASMISLLGTKRSLPRKARIVGALFSQRQSAENARKERTINDPSCSAFPSARMTDRGDLSLKETWGFALPTPFIISATVAIRTFRRLHQTFRPVQTAFFDRANFDELCSWSF